MRYEPIRERAQQLITSSGIAPKMYAHTKEAFVSHVTTIMEMYDDDFDCAEFYMEFFKLTVAGRTLFNIDMLSEEFTDEWARKVVELAQRNF